MVINNETFFITGLNTKQAYLEGKGSKKKNIQEAE